MLPLHTVDQACMSDIGKVITLPSGILTNLVSVPEIYVEFQCVTVKILSKMMRLQHLTPSLHNRGNVI